jgi:hypothetical protein
MAETRFLGVEDDRVASETGFLGQNPCWEGKVMTETLIWQSLRGVKSIKG